MNPRLLEDALEHKIFENWCLGLRYEDAVSRAGDEILAQAGLFLSRAELFCFKLRVKGAQKRLRRTSAPAESAGRDERQGASVRPCMQPETGRKWEAVPHLF